MADSPILTLLFTAAAAWFLREWWGDLRDWRAGTPRAGAYPGATDAPRSLYVVGVVAAVLLVVLETAAEMALGLTDEQTEMTLATALYAVIGAPFVEELIYRGYLVFDRRGPAAAWAAAAGVSVVFALIHLHLFEWGDEGFAWTLTVKGWFSTAFLFASSMLFYALRLAPANAHGSLLPCFVAHAAKNLTVVAIKAGQGFLVLAASGAG